MRLQVVSLFLVAAVFIIPAPAFAAPVVSLNPKPDGTLVLVGSGWRPGQELVISLGTDQFPALADSSGSFEVPTGLLVSGGPPLSITVRRPDASSLAFAHLGPPPALDGGGANAFALLFAQSLAMGATWFGLSAGSLGLAALAARAIRVRARKRAS